ncbi:hypothetical protein TH63_03565 [Rufibacter radiotolerans]|uniref:Uncharacterized protein n=2 Tax=Rufibacter radiotolerans TaxID=1379910 RepID=A0A0H4VH00_9BACT|nr:hypothetical protein TH63_03565 [Rufibacter radiotolerans]
MGAMGLLKAMEELFDYIFYRVYKAYQKRDSTPEIYAAGVLSLMQFFFLLCILVFIGLFVEFPIPHKYYALPFIILILGINWFKYERNFNVKELELKWGKEDRSIRKRRGWLLVLCLISLILFPIVIGVLKHNLNLL